MRSDENTRVSSLLLELSNKTGSLQSEVDALRTDRSRFQDDVDRCNAEVVLPPHAVSASCVLSPFCHPIVLPSTASFGSIVIVTFLVPHPHAHYFSLSSFSASPLSP